MDGKKKPTGLLAMFSGSPKGGPEDDSADDMESAKMSAAEDIISATKSGDAAGLADAYQRMYDACAGKMGMGDEDEEY